MTGRTALETYAVIEPPAAGDAQSIWTATIYRKGFKRTQTLVAYNDQHLREQCRARGVFEFRSADSAERAEGPPIQP